MKRNLILITATLLIGLASADASNRCPTGFKSLRTLQEVVGRALSKNEEVAIRKAGSIGHRDTYLPSEVEKQNELLKKAGLSSEEIGKLRTNGILGNSVVHWHGTVPQEVAFKNLGLRPLESQHIQEIRKGKPLAYYMDFNGDLYVGDSAALTKDKLWLSKIKNSDGTDRLIVIEEAGEIISTDKKTFRLKPSFALDDSQDHSQAIAERIKPHAQTLQETHGVAPEISVTGTASKAETRVLTCLDILNQQSLGAGFIKDRLIATNAVFATAVISTEGLGAGRLATPEGREVILADFISTNLGSVISGTVGKKLALNSSSFITSFGTRTATNLGVVQVQNELIYQNVLTDQTGKRADSIANFDRAMAPVWPVIGHYVDKALVEKVPLKFFDACKRDSKLKVLISPTAVRMYSNFGTALMYYGLRKAIIQE